MSAPHTDLNVVGTERMLPRGLSPRFEKRWHLVGAGLSNVWRFGDLELSAKSGRLLLRGPNGTGKTTALEALWPYLLDLNPARLAAGKARTTSLSSLMREGAAGKRRFGYAWLTLNDAEEGNWSFGVRLQYSDGASPPVRVIPFAVPGRPLQDLELHRPGRVPLTAEQFAEAVAAGGGHVFESEDAYVSHLAVRIFATPDANEPAKLAARLRQVRNPTNLADVTPQAAAIALRESLPGVAEEVIAATAEALAESDATREAFERDKLAADLLADFAEVWSAHATDMVRSAHAGAARAAAEVKARQKEVEHRDVAYDKAARATAEAREHLRAREEEQVRLAAEIQALEKSEAYRAAGRLNDLRATLEARQKQAHATVAAMTDAARTLADRGVSLRKALDGLVEDIVDLQQEAVSADRSGGAPRPLLSWSDEARPALSAGDVHANPGPALRVHGDGDQLREAARVWMQRADWHTARSDAAQLALTDHRDVERADRLARDAAREAEVATHKVEQETSKARKAEVAATAAASRLIESVLQWTSLHPGLSNGGEHGGGAGDDHAEWDSDALAQLTGAEPAQTLTVVEEWAAAAVSRAQARAAGLRASAASSAKQAAELREKAQGLRRDAADLRAGRLLPFPRPEWAGAGVDGAAFGTALEWAEGWGDDRTRALVEAGFAASGLLGAAIGESGAATEMWWVGAVGPVVTPNLTDAIAIDRGHPRREAAAAVLARVALVDSVSSAGELPEERSGLAIGRDGSFRAGVLHGRVAGADDPAQLPAASHVGSRQRRAAALRRAGELEAAAALTQLDAESCERAARAALEAADRLSETGRAFPSRVELRHDESWRAAAMQALFDVREAAGAARDDAETRAGELHRARTAWIERTRAVGVPTDIDELKALESGGRSSAERLRKAARSLADKLARRLDDFRTDHAQLESHATDRLRRVEIDARDANRQVLETTTELSVLEETQGVAMKDVLARHSRSRSRLEAVNRELAEGRSRSELCVRDELEAKADQNTARSYLDAAITTAARELDRLHGLVQVPGVGDAILDGAQPLAAAELLDQVGSKLEGRKSMTRRTVREREDRIRAELAGVWSLDPGEDHGELLTYVLTHRDESRTPPAAAVYAETLRRRAEEALAASEERALREFVIGRLPSAIGTAWTRLHDWVAEVNRKMRSATASSGVGVQVRAVLQQDLVPAQRTVYELSCQVSDADRTPEQQRELGAALHALMAASDADSMHEQVSRACDVREWVDVHYEVTRPGGRTQKWNSRTGLSGGERRLVVFAPMLAAVAAGYDRYGERALRIVALDEVPAEVDEQGREGLARYLAELDLDLVCTSYVWDGCPGAWDGIDAYDLEAGPDGTVVAFPMLVRGLLDMPGDNAVPVDDGAGDEG